jgi:hypothetical protein
MSVELRPLSDPLSVTRATGEWTWNIGGMVFATLKQTRVRSQDSACIVWGRQSGIRTGSLFTKNLSECHSVYLRRYMHCLVKEPRSVPRELALRQDRWYTSHFKWKTYSTFQNNPTNSLVVEFLPGWNNDFIAARRDHICCQIRICHVKMLSQLFLH